MCDSQSTKYNKNYYENVNVEDLNNEVFKCIECNTISYKRLMCDCNIDKAKEYMDNNPYSRLSLNLVKCYKCNNCWHGYKRCDCDSLEDTSKEEVESNSDYNKHYFNDYIKCTNCGNIWDGCAQCNCWGLDSFSYQEDNTENTCEDIEQMNDTDNTCNY